MASIDLCTLTVFLAQQLTLFRMHNPVIHFWNPIPIISRFPSALNSELD